ncbi:hypothetical protein pdam_00004803 [Pocillopora damicornis]|uniref:Uncharacterized protein n=1 Tax=Pocillopora damicornis TaxID=46731 RepID=A0A3M6U9I5_POCDA|nr:uncharacterized protein LOC113667114 [Pocillopora damicornis]RMX50194.1 hypothetical protein pdam_00004803 [Pocillopora damicornis]
MAPGKTHVHSKHKNKLHTKRKSSSGVKKAKKSTLSNKQLKEKTFQQIEEVNKSFTAVHNITSIKSRTQRESVSTERLAHVKISKEKLIAPNTNVTQEELLKTVEDIANL